MPEAYTWMEGRLSIWTGTATAQAVVAFAQNSQAIEQWGWEEHQTVSGEYADHLTGQRIDATVQAVFTHDNTLQKIARAATAVHMHFYHSGIHGSAGLFLYSGRIDTLAHLGSEEHPYVYSLACHAHNWSGYGGG